MNPNSVGQNPAIFSGTPHSDLCLRPPLARCHLVAPWNCPPHVPNNVDDMDAHLRSAAPSDNRVAKRHSAGALARGPRNCTLRAKWPRRPRRAPAAQHIKKGSAMQRTLRWQNGYTSKHTFTHTHILTHTITHSHTHTNTFALTHTHILRRMLLLEPGMFPDQTIGVLQACERDGRLQKTRRKV